MREALLVPAVLLGAWGGLGSIHLTVLTVASLFFRRATGSGERRRFCVLIPAHNEALVIADTLAALQRALRPGDVVVVVADRCTDSTAELARQGGALVVERDESATPGKSAAMRAGLEAAAALEWDVLATIDADSRVEPGYFEAVEAVMGTGCELAQARSEASDQDGITQRLGQAAFALQGVTIPRGKDRLGLSVRMRGTGMIMSRRLAYGEVFVEEGASEDLRLGFELLMRGWRARHVDQARLTSLSPPTIAAATEQRARWEAGRMMAARRYAPRMLLSGRPSAVESAIHTLAPPFAIAILSLSLAAVLSLVAGHATVAIIWLALLGAMAVDLGVGLVQARAPRATWMALAAAPFYVVWKVWIQIVAMRRLGRADKAWTNTPRA
jgi:cellulose synthase/poly-beta-1,6-N-acetylglucosamine synthase-like glycosyltransferase